MSILINASIALSILRVKGPYGALGEGRNAAGTTFQPRKNSPKEKNAARQ